MNNIMTRPEREAFKAQMEAALEDGATVALKPERVLSLIAHTEDIEDELAVVSREVEALTEELEGL